MTYTSRPLILDTAAIVVAKETLQALIAANTEQLASFSLADAIAWLEGQLPELREMTALLTWANALEQASHELPETAALWRQVLQTEGYTLRLRAKAFPQDTAQL